MSGTDALWQVSLLGGLALSDGTQQLTRLPTRAVTALLARLALAPERAHGREELIELLWPGVSLVVGRNRLRQALSTLKGILEPADRFPTWTSPVGDGGDCNFPVSYFPHTSQGATDSWAVWIGFGGPISGKCVVTVTLAP